MAPPPQALRGAFKTIDALNTEKQYPRYDEKIDRDGQKIAPADNGALLLRLESTGEVTDLDRGMK